MEESIFEIVKQINQLHQKAYDVYYLLIEDICKQEVPKNEFYDSEQRLKDLREIVI